MKRVKSVVNGKTIYNVYDAAGRLVHVDEVGGGETDYLHGMGQTLARIKDGEFTYLHPDHLGSPQVGTNEAGAVSFTERYTPFGEALINAAANDNQSGFTGHIKDKSTGLNYMQARYYDPNVGRFLSVDPVGFLDTGDARYFNRYAYVGNDPINYIDPFGEELRKYEDVKNNDDGTTTTNVTLKFDAAFSVKGGQIPEGQTAQGLADIIASDIESTFTGTKVDSKGNTTNYTMEADIRVGEVSGGENSIYHVAHGSLALGSSGEGIGSAVIGNGKHFNMSDTPTNSSASGYGRTGSHEFGHTFGLGHTSRNTIMRQSAFTDSRKTTSIQMNRIRTNAKQWRPPLK